MQRSPHSESPCLARTGKRSFHPMTDVPHQWVFDHLSALCLLGEMDKEEVERIHALFVQRFPDEVASLKQQVYDMAGLLGEATDVFSHWALIDKHFLDGFMIDWVGWLNQARAFADMYAPLDLEQQGD